MKPPIADPITPKLRRRIDEAAKATGQPATKIVRKAIEAHLADLEDLQYALAAEKRARTRRPFQEIARELGLAR